MKLYSQQDYSKIPALNFVVAVGASAPSDPVQGELWYDTSAGVSGALKVYNGSGWVNFLDRSQHSGTQTASTISDFNATVRANRLDQMAAPQADLDANNVKITNLANPTSSSSSDAASASWVSSQIASFLNGQDWKASVRAATTANITLSGTQTIDGVALEAGDRVLVKNQTTGSQNGIYVVAADAWTRATDADSDADVTKAMTVPVEGGGTTNGGTVWLLSNSGAITVGTTDLTFVQIGAAGAAYTAGAGLTANGNEFNVVAADGSIAVNADSITVGLVPIAKGGTGATSAASARSSTGLGVQDGLVSHKTVNVPAISAGATGTITHNLGTTKVQCVFKNASGGRVVHVDWAPTDPNTITLYPDAAIPVSTLVAEVQGAG